MYTQARYAVIARKMKFTHRSAGATVDAPSRYYDWFKADDAEDLRVMFAVDEIDETLERLHKRGAQLVGEVLACSLYFAIDKNTRPMN